MQIIVDTNEPDERLKLAVEQALTELERRTGQQFQVVVKPKGASQSQSQGSTIHQSSPQQSAPASNPGGGVAASRAKQMEQQMGRVDLSILGNPKKSPY